MYEISKKLRMIARMYEAPSITVPFAPTSWITELALEKILRFASFLKRRERFSFCVLIEDTSIIRLHSPLRTNINVSCSQHKKLEI